MNNTTKLTRVRPQTRKKITVPTKKVAQCKPEKEFQEAIAEID